MESYAAELDSLGYLVRRHAFDASALSEEADVALREGVCRSFSAGVAGELVRGAYVPMMSDRTPTSLGLLDELAILAEALLGRPVLPVRAKVVRYFGGVSWHRDTELPLKSLGFLAYLEPLDASNGALRVIPGSHRAGVGQEVLPLPDDSPVGSTLEETVARAPGSVIETKPGDIIVMDEHLLHASVGGRNRRQWRVDFVPDPRTLEEEALTKRYFDAIYRVGWDGGYDSDTYPTYGPTWLGSGRACLRRLEALGAHAAAIAEEAWARAHRS